MKPMATGDPFRSSGKMTSSPFCSSSSLDDYNDVSFTLLNQNGEEVIFPDDLKGSPVAMGFIYTNCPDICSFITANLYKVWTEMEQPDDIHFVLVTFDPQRDTPEALKSYANSFTMDQPPFTFLTGSEEEIGAMLERFGINKQVSYTHETADGGDVDFLNRS